MTFKKMQFRAGTIVRNFVIFRNEKLSSCRSQQQCFDTRVGLSGRVFAQLAAFIPLQMEDLDWINGSNG
jgi:hypothetical protein